MTFKGDLKTMCERERANISMLMEPTILRSESIITVSGDLELVRWAYQRIAFITCKNLDASRLKQ
eukprot:12404052-Karenia_brevis.AAC.1